MVQNRNTQQTQGNVINAEELHVKNMPLATVDGGKDVFIYFAGLVWDKFMWYMGARQG